MARCRRCKRPYDPRREEAGYDTCLRCGDKEARKEAHRVRESVALTFNKGSYQPLVGDEDLDELG